MNLLFNLCYFCALVYFNVRFILYSHETKKVLGNCYSSDTANYPLFDGIQWP